MKKKNFDIKLNLAQPNILPNKMGHNNKMLNDKKTYIELFKIVNDHYRNDINSVWTRGQFFVLVHGALIGYITSCANKNPSLSKMPLVSGFGIFMGILWLILAFITTLWIKEWRNVVIAIEEWIFVRGPYVTGENGSGFHRYVRPQHIACAVALISIFFWFYVFFKGVTWVNIPETKQSIGEQLLPDHCVTKTMARCNSAEARCEARGLASATN